MAPRNDPREMSEVVPRHFTTAAQLAAGPIAAAAAVAATRAANFTDFAIDTDVAVDESPNFHYLSDFDGIPGLLPAATGEGISEGERISGNVNAPLSVREASGTPTQRHDLPAAVIQGDHETSTTGNMERNSCRQLRKRKQPMDKVDTADVDVRSLSTRPCRPQRNIQSIKRFDPEHARAARRTSTYADCPCAVCELTDDEEGWCVTDATR